MILEESKYLEYKTKLLDYLNKDNFLALLKQHSSFNRNFQYQVYLLSQLNELNKKVDIEIETILVKLKQQQITIHFFNEYLSESQIISLLESNQYKIQKEYDNVNNIIQVNPEAIFVARQEFVNTVQNRKLKQKEYIDLFIKHKKDKEIKKIKAKSLTISMFYSFVPKKKKIKISQLLCETRDYFNNAVHTQIEPTDQEFVTIFYEYIINAAIKKSLLILLLVLVIILIVVIITIVLLTVK